jgi:hypothetical protein
MMSSNEDVDVAKAMKAVRKAYDDLQALRTSRNSMIPLSLLVASTALDKLLCNLNLVADSTEALAIFCAFSLKETSIPFGTLLSGALVHDMEAMARHFRLMTPANPLEIMDDFDEGECRDIAGMVNRYDRTVFSVLVQRPVCVQDNRWYIVLTDGVLTILDRSPSESLTDQSYDVMDGIDQIRRRLLEQEASETAKIRTSEHIYDLRTLVSAADPCTEVYDRLRPIASANYDSHTAPTGCLDGTRVKIRQKLFDWANDNASGLSTVWLNGMAGTGKTAIATTFAKTMQEQGILGATFFIDRQRAERRDMRRIVQTLAYDLAKHNHEQLRALWTVLRDDPTFDRLSYQEQVRLLINNPLNVGHPATLVVVIDGLDECGAADGASLLKTLITSLTHHPIKLFVTSRNEADISNILCVLPHTALSLQGITVSGDTRLWWQLKLDELCRCKRLPDWRFIVSLDELVKLTGHLFIYATTLFEIIQDTKTSPIKELVKFLEISRGGNVYAISFANPAVNHGPLEKLYSHILTETVKDKRGNIRADYAMRMHDILEVVIFAREPLSPHALSDILDMDRGELTAYFMPLRSVLMIPEASDLDAVIRPLHQSFPDFVRQQAGLIHPQLAIHPTVAEGHVTERCMFQLNKHLRFNICDIQDASLFNHEVSNLLTRLNQCIPAALRYSCRYWPSHLLNHIQAAGSQSQVPSGLASFCEEHLLHWIEVLSLTGDMNAVQRVMPELISLMNVRPFHS